jgi:hypothetical protein
MIHIEGTPHEKATIVICAYIIGFVTAYIAFAEFSPNSYETVSYLPVPVENAANVTEATTQSSNASPGTSTPTNASTESFSVVYENQGLYVRGVSEYPLLLSKQIDAVNRVYKEDMALREKQGLHSSLPTYDYSPTQGYVAFCESYEAQQVCTPYVFDVNDKTLYPVEYNQEQVSVSVTDTLNLDIDEDGVLTIGNYQSITNNQVWNVRPQ